MSANRRRPNPPWRKGNYSPLREPVLIALVKSDLTARAKDVFLVLAQETWGHPNYKHRDYGRPSAAVSVTEVAKRTNSDPKTVRRGLKELEDGG